MSHRILITGSRHFVALTEARKLNASGKLIFTADSVDFDYTMYSNAVEKYFKVPSVRFDEDGYIEAICKIVSENSIDTIVSLGEETFYLAKHISTLNRLCGDINTNFDDFDKLMQLHDKMRFYELAKKLKINTPKTTAVRSLNEVIDWQKHNGYHAVLKPTYTRFGHELLELKSIDKKLLSKVDWTRGYILQEFVEGEDYSTFSLDNSSPVLTYKNSFKMKGRGAMAAPIRLKSDNYFSDIDRQIRKKLNYKGQLGLDFIVNKDGGIYLLEANPRATMGRLLSDKTKIQFRIMMLHQLLNGFVPIKSIVKYCWIMMTYPDAVWKWTDLGPALMSQIASKGLGTYLRFLRNNPGLGFQAYSSYDMEFNGDEKYSWVETPKDSDDKLLLKMLESFYSGGMFQLTYTRRPSALDSFVRDKAEVGIIKTSNNNIAYMFACSENKYYINGKIMSLRYLSSLRKDRKYLYVLDWREQILSYLGRGTYFFSVLCSNKRAHQLIERKSENFNSPQRLARYKTFIINSRRIEKPKKLVCEFRAVGDNDINAIIMFLNKEGQKKNLFPVVTKELLDRLGITKNNSYLLIKDDKIVGFAGLVDQSDWKQFIVVKYSWLLSSVRKPFNTFAKRFRYITIPEINQPIKSPLVTMCVVKNDNLKLFKEMFYYLSSQASKTSDIFVYSQLSNTKETKMLDTKYNFSFEYEMYLLEEDINLKLDNKSIYIDTAMLY